MSNNLQVLRALKQSAVEKNKELESSIKEIHKQSLKELNEDFKNITNKKLNSIEKNINLTMQDIQEQNKWRYSLITTSATALIFLLIGVILAEYTPRINSQIAWTVPEEHRIKVEGMKYTKVEKSKLLINSSTPDYRYIKITEQ